MGNPWKDLEDVINNNNNNNSNNNHNVGWSLLDSSGSG